MHGYCAVCQELRKDMTAAEHIEFVRAHAECVTFAELVRTFYQPPTQGVTQ